MSPRKEKSSGLGALVFTALALVFTGITAWLLAMMLAGTEYTGEPVKPVVVLKGAVEPLQPVTAESLRIIKVPESTIPSGSYSKVEDVVSTPPARALVRLHEGEIVLQPRLADPKTGRALASFIPPGKRAMVVQVDVAAALARLFYPGATVDVLATLRLEQQNKTVTRIILHNVKLLAVGTDVDPAYLKDPKASTAYSEKVDEKSKVVTLLVTPEQAEQLTLAARKGKIDVVLRSPVDQTAPETVGATPEDLFPDLQPEEETKTSRRSATRRVLSRSRFKKPVASGGSSIEVR